MKGSVQHPEIRNSWLRLVLYLILVFFGVGITYVLVLLLFPDLMDLSKAEYRRALDEPFLVLVNTMAISGGIILATFLIIRKIEQRTFHSIRLSFNFKEVLYGCIFAIVIMVLFAVCAESFHLVEIRYQGFSVRLVYSLVIYFLVAASEELLFRGYVMHNLLEKMNPVGALLLSSALFGLAHIGNDYFTWVGYLTISLSGFLMGIMTLKWLSLSGAIGFHWAWNFVQGPVIGFAVSGNQEHGLLRPELISHTNLTGGFFGAEGSIVLASITGVIALGAWLKLRNTLQNIPPAS